MKSLIFPVTFFCWVFTGCSVFHRERLSYNLTKTSWIYTDSDWTYTIEFSKRGKLYSTHPNDKTRGNDFWEQHGNIIHFSYNDKFSLYEGRLTHKDTIRGKGYNKLMNWDFQLTRKK